MPVNKLILKERTFTVRRFGRGSPSVDSGRTLVLLRKGQPWVTLAPGQTLTSGERLFAGFRQGYEVDMAEQTLDFSCELPAREEPFRFSALVHVRYRVVDPMQIVRNRLTDPQTALQKFIGGLLREQSARCSVADRAQLEASLSEVVRSSRHAGLAVSACTLEVDPDEEAAAHLRRIARGQRGGPAS